MRASIGLAILKGNLNLGEIAKQFNVTPERVTQIVKDVKTTKFGEIAISRMSNLSFTYQAAYNAFIRDIEQLDGIGERLASARGVRGDRITNIAKLGKLKTIEVQIDKLPQAYQDARNKFDAAIDAADSAYVDKVKGLCSYAASTGQGCAGMHYPLEECKAYDRAKGDFKLRRALHAGLSI